MKYVQVQNLPQTAAVVAEQRAQPPARPGRPGSRQGASPRAAPLPKVDQVYSVASPSPKPRAPSRRQAAAKVRMSG